LVLGAPAGRRQVQLAQAHDVGEPQQAVLDAVDRERPDPARHRQRHRQHEQEPQRGQQRVPKHGQAPILASSSCASARWRPPGHREFQLTVAVSAGEPPAAPYTRPMLTTVTAGPHSVRGISVGGVYTSLAVPELGLLFDAGAPLRSLAAIDTILLSHGHADHVGALPALLGIRGLTSKTRPPRVVMPAEIEADLTEALAALSRLQRFPLEIQPIGLRPGDELELRGDLRIRAVRTFHPVPSLGYLVV